MDKKLIIETLPVTEERLTRRRLIQERGELAFLEDGQIFKHLAIFTLRPGSGLFRGGHWHRHKEEHFYIIKGRGKFTTLNPQTGQREEYILKTGQRITILPGLGHRFDALEDCKELAVIEYYNGVYDPEDDIPLKELR